MGHACCHPPHCHYDDYHCDSEPVYCNSTVPPNYQTMYPQPTPVHPLQFPPPGPPMPPGPPPPPLMFPSPGLFGTPPPPPRY